MAEVSAKCEQRARFIISVNVLIITRLMMKDNDFIASFIARSCLIFIKFSRSNVEALKIVYICSHWPRATWKLAANIYSKDIIFFFMRHTILVLV